jgi:outer membrane protein assembly factor BamB
MTNRLVVRIVACLSVLPTFVFGGGPYYPYGGGPYYPENPSVTRDAIYTASIGVSRYERKDLHHTWHALADLETFEPVVTKTAVLVGSTNGLYALDPLTGKTQWHIGSTQPMYSPAVSDGTAYVGAADGMVRAVHLKTGMIVWRRQFDGWIYPPAIVEGLLVLGGSDGRLHGVDAGSGTLVWSRSVSQELVYRPVAAPNGRVIVTTFSGEVIAVSVSDGKTIWKVRDSTPGFSPLVRDKRLYMGTFGGALRVRDVMNGRLIWTRFLDEKLPFVPQLNDGVVLIGSDQGRVAAFSADAGELLWRQEQPRALAANPVMVDGRIVAFSEDGQLVNLTPTALKNAIYSQ